MPSKTVADFVGPPSESDARREAAQWTPYMSQNVGPVGGDGFYAERNNGGTRDFMTAGNMDMTVPVDSPLIPSADADMTYAGMGRKWGLLNSGPMHVDLGGGVYLVDLNAQPNVDVSGVPGLLQGQADTMARQQFKDQMPGYTGPAAWPTLTLGYDPVNLDISYLPAKSLMGIGEDVLMGQVRMPFEWDGSW